MGIFTIMPYYFAWHYTYSIRNFLAIWSNFLWFVWNFFSLKVLLRTFFSPFERITEHYKGGLNLQDFFESLVANTLMRILGMIVRTFFIIIGIISWLLTLFVCLVSFLIWLVMPFLIVFILVASLIAIFKSV